MGGLSDADPRYQRGANYFPPLTPEQKAQLEAQSIRSFNPEQMAMDIAPYLYGGGFGAATYGLARAFGLPRAISAAKGAIAGGSAGLRSANKVDEWRVDAENQPGSFYGLVPGR